MRVAAVIANYNMLERAGDLLAYIEQCAWPCDVILVDNGSNLVPPHHKSAVLLRENVQTTAAWLMGLSYADHLARKRGSPYFAYWILITSTEFVGGDPLTPMCELLHDDPGAVGVHPALTADSTTSWEHLKARGGAPRQTWMVDNIAALYRADWFDSIGRFDPRYVYAWGPDLETGLLARRQGRTLWVHEGARVKKVTDVAYRMDRMGMSAEERRRLAGANMRDVFLAKYGPDYWKVVTEEGVTDAMR